MIPYDFGMYRLSCIETWSIATNSVYSAAASLVRASFPFRAMQSWLPFPLWQPAFPPLSFICPLHFPFLFLSPPLSPLFHPSFAHHLNTLSLSEAYYQHQIHFIPAY